MNYFCNSVTGALKPSQQDQCLNLHFSFTMQLPHQLTFQTNYKFSPCPYNRLTIHFIPFICKRLRSHTQCKLSRWQPSIFTSSNQSTSKTNLLCIKTSSHYNRTLNVCSPLNAAEYLF